MCYNFAMNAKVTPDTNSGATDPTITPALGKVTYVLKNGVYDFKYDLIQDATTGTFSTHDSYGTYKATLTLTDTNL